MQPGDLIGPVEVGAIAHGGHCVSRVDGRVVFVRHALPGEQVVLRITEVASRFARGDAVEAVVAAPQRVSPPCPVAGRCGGCDFQHVEPAFQAELKRRVLAEQLHRLAGIEWHGEVEQVPPVLGSRTRMRFVGTGDGRLGLRAHRSHEVVPLPDDGCRIAHPMHAVDHLRGRQFPLGQRRQPLAAGGLLDQHRRNVVVGPGRGRWPRPCIRPALWASSSGPPRRWRRSSRFR